MPHRSPCTAQEWRDLAQLAPLHPALQLHPMTQLRRYAPHPMHEVERLRGLLLASFWRRGAALAIDVAISGAVLGVLAVGGGLLLETLGWNWWDPTVNNTIEIRFVDNWYSLLWHVLFLGISNHL